MGTSPTQFIASTSPWMSFTACELSQSLLACKFSTSLDEEIED